MGMVDQYETAIIFFSDQTPPIKYRNIKRRDTLISHLQRKYPKAHYINWYRKRTKQFIERQYLTTEKPA